MDILPSILDLIGIKQDIWLGESFAPWLLADRSQQRSDMQKPKLSIQPYGGGFISIVQYPMKYLFDMLGQNIKVYDLNKDPEERSPDIRDSGDYICLIRNFFLQKGDPDRHQTVECTKTEPTGQ